MNLFSRLFKPTEAPPAPAKAAEDTMPSTTDAAGVSTGQRPTAPAPQAGGYTPAKVAQVHAGALQGDETAIAEWFRLADHTFERDQHAAASLGALARAVAGRTHYATPPKGDTSRRARRIADEFQALIEPGSALRLAAPALISKGISHGLAVASVGWKTGATAWTPAAFVQKPSHFFTFDRTDGATVLLRSAMAGGKPTPLEHGLSFVFAPRVHDPLQVKNGLAWFLSWVYVVKTITLNNEAAFIEAFGSPVVTGTYKHGTPEKDVSLLRNAVAQLSAMSRAVFREDLKVEVKEIARGGTDIHEKLCRYLDELTSKVILGSTLTTDGGGGGTYALGKVHAEGKYDTVGLYAQQWAAALQQLAAVYTAWNYGPDAPVPRITVEVEEAEDLVAGAQVVASLVAAGVRLDEDEIRERFGFRKPEEGASVVGGGAGPVGPAPTEPTPPTGQAMQGPASTLPCGCSTNHAQASSTTGRAPDAIDRLAAEMLADFDPLGTAIDAALAQAAASVASPEDLPAAIAQALAALDVRELQTVFAKSRAQAQLGGYSGGDI